MKLSTTFKSVTTKPFFTDDMIIAFYNLLIIPIFLVRIEENLFKT